MGFLQQSWTCQFIVHPTLVHSSTQIEQQKLMYIVSFYRKEKYDRSALNILTDPLDL